MRRGFCPMMPDFSLRSQARKCRDRRSGRPSTAAAAHIVDLDNNFVNTNAVAMRSKEGRHPLGERRMARTRRPRQSPLPPRRAASARRSRDRADRRSVRSTAISAISCAGCRSGSSRISSARLARIDISPAQFSVLVVISANCGLSQAELPATLGIERARLVRLLHRLERSRLISASALLRRRPPPCAAAHARRPAACWRAPRRWPRSTRRGYKRGSVPSVTDCC